MTTFSKILVAVAAAATLGATVNSAFAHGHGDYRPSYGSYHLPTAAISHTTTAISLPTTTMLMTTPATTAMAVTAGTTTAATAASLAVTIAGVESAPWPRPTVRRRNSLRRTARRDRDRSCNSILASGSAPRRSASRPFCSTTCKSFNAAPVGWRSPRSHISLA